MVHHSISDSLRSATGRGEYVAVSSHPFMRDGQQRIEHAVRKQPGRSVYVIVQYENGAYSSALREPKPRRALATSARP